MPSLIAFFEKYLSYMHSGLGPWYFLLLQTMEQNKQNKLSVEDEEKSCIEKKKQQAHWRDRVEVYIHSLCGDCQMFRNMY